MDFPGLTRYLEQLLPAGSETAYERMTAYGFARRYVGGKAVADINPQWVGYGSRLLAETAVSVVGLISSAEDIDLASAAYPAPNLHYRRAKLPELPYPAGSFDVVIALGAPDDLERPGDLIEEARRVLKQNGMLVISSLDRGIRPDQGRGMYVSEFRELLERHFASVRLYRQGTVAGGFVSPLVEEVTGASVETASLSLTDPRVNAEPPASRSVVAVCGDAEIPEEEPYLLLDRDRRVFDECENATEDVELLRDEIQRMQDTEVQAFQDSFKIHSTELAYVRAQLRRARAQEQAIRNSTTWRLFEPYRRLRSRLEATRKSSPDGAEGNSGDRPG